MWKRSSMELDIKDWIRKHKTGNKLKMVKINDKEIKEIIWWVN